MKTAAYNLVRKTIKRVTNKPHFRAAHISDIKFLVALDGIEYDTQTQSAENQLRRQAYWEGQLSNPAQDTRTFIAQLGGLYLGYAIIEMGEQRIANDVFVSPRHRGNGIAAGLLGYAGVSCEAHDATILLLRDAAPYPGPAISEIDVAV